MSERRNCKPSWRTEAYFKHTLPFTQISWLVTITRLIANNQIQCSKFCPLFYNLLCSSVLVIDSYYLSEFKYFPNIQCQRILKYGILLRYRFSKLYFYNHYIVQHFFMATYLIGTLHMKNRETMQIYSITVKFSNIFNTVEKLDNLLKFVITCKIWYKFVIVRGCFGMNNILLVHPPPRASSDSQWGSKRGSLGVPVNIIFERLVKLETSYPQGVSGHRVWRPVGVNSFFACLRRD